MRLATNYAPYEEVMKTLSHCRRKSLATLGGWSRLLPLRHGSCDLQRPRPIFENYHVIFVRACRLVRAFFRKRQRKAAQSYKT